MVAIVVQGYLDDQPEIGDDKLVLGLPVLEPGCIRISLSSSLARTGCFDISYRYVLKGSGLSDVSCPLSLPIDPIAYAFMRSASFCFYSFGALFSVEQGDITRNMPCRKNLTLP